MADCYRPFVLNIPDARRHGPVDIILPCGKCFACKENRSHEWMLRIIHELEQHDKSCFVTLTYDPKYLPEFGSLVPSHLVLFFKRLRKNNPGLKLKYYACGEYGDDRNRPHYHIILFGIDDVKKISDSWGMGFVHAGVVTPASAKYVTQYIDKIYTGSRNEWEYTNNKLHMPFQRQSQGLGLSWALAQAERLRSDLYVGYLGSKYPVPRYYKKMLDITYDDFESIIDDKQIQSFISLAKRGCISIDERRKRLAEIRDQVKRDYLSKLELRSKRGKRDKA